MWWGLIMLSGSMLHHEAIFKVQKKIAHSRDNGSVKTIHDQYFTRCILRNQVK